jgi:cbb3-type cytochrome oxidase subunit 3
VIRLSELVSALTPAQYAELSLVLFLLVFAGVLLRHGGKRRAAEHAACAELPLADDAGWRRNDGRNDAGGSR